jgi:hypothetical protein
MNLPTKNTITIIVLSLLLSATVLYTPLLADWMARTRVEAAVRADLAGVLPQLYTPPEAVELSRQELPFNYNLTSGCVGDQEAITYGTNQALSRVILQYNQGMLLAGWHIEPLAKPDANFASYTKDPHSRLAVGAAELIYPPVDVSDADRQRYQTIYSVFLEYFSPGYACRA